MATPKTRYNAIGVSGKPGGDTNPGYSDAAIKAVTRKLPIVASTAEQDLDFTFPDRAAPIMVKINVKTAESTGATKTVDVGVTGSPDALIDDADVSADGFVGTLIDADLSGASLTYALGSADFAELDAEVTVLYLLAEV